MTRTSQAPKSELSTERGVRVAMASRPTRRSRPPPSAQPQETDGAIQASRKKQKHREQPPVTLVEVAGFALSETEHARLQQLSQRAALRGALLNLCALAPMCAVEQLRRLPSHGRVYGANMVTCTHAWIGEMKPGMTSALVLCQSCRWRACALGWLVVAYLTSPYRSWRVQPGIVS